MTTTKFYTVSANYGMEVFLSNKNEIVFEMTDVNEPEDSSYLPLINLSLEDAKKMIVVLSELTKSVKE